MNQFFRLAMAFIWIVIFWGLLGGIIEVVATEAPIWLGPALSAIGAMAMWFHVVSKELSK